MTEVAPASVAREMNLLKSVLRYARTELEWIRADPMADIRRPGGHRARDRRVSDDELERMRLALGWVADVPPANASQRIAVMMLVAVETAMRSGELCSLTWDLSRMSGHRDLKSLRRYYNPAAEEIAERLG